MCADAITGTAIVKIFAPVPKAVPAVRNSMAGGTSKEFYEAVSSEICLWPTPTWVWDNRNGNLKTLEVRDWIDEIGVKENYKAFEGSQVIYL
jgi:hypothetical protein